MQYIFAAACMFFLCFFPDKIIKWKKKEIKEDISKKNIKLFTVINFIVTACFLVSECITEDAMLKMTLTLLTITTTGIISIVDIKARIIPNILLLFILILSLILHILYEPIQSLVPDFVMMLMACLGLCSVVSIAGQIVGAFKGSMGAGDIKYIAVIAFSLGTSGRFIYAVIGMAVSYFVVIIPLMILKKMGRYSYIPFGPFISFGFMFSLSSLISLFH